MKASKPAFLTLFFFLSLAGYIIIGYGIERSQFDLFIAIYGVLFLIYFLSLKWIETNDKIKLAVTAALLFRVALLFSFPTLSDDFYRFIWDGRLLAHGINPFAHTPQFYIQTGLPYFLTAHLFEQLSSLSQIHYTVYPPVAQYIFGFSALIGGSSILANAAVMKTIMVLFELGTFGMIKKLLNHFNLPLKYLLIYALNPLIILEITGNLHLEGAMIFFLLAAFWLFLKRRFWFGSICFLLAVNTKLIPLILLPYLIFSLRWKESAKLIAVVGFGTVLLHIPFLGSDFIVHFGDSLALYFQSFEFNASLYYLVRWAGFQAVGYNVIQTAAPILAGLSTITIIAISWIKRDASLKNLPLVYIVIVTIYYLFSTTVHPWYIASLIAFAPLAGLLYPVVWSALIPLTYITYSTPVYNENLWLVGVEYIIVFVFIGYDFYRKRLPRK